VKNPLDLDAVLLSTCIPRIDSPVSRIPAHILNTLILKMTDAWGLITHAQILLTHQVLIPKIWSNIQFQRELLKSLDKVQHLDQFVVPRSTKAVMRQMMEEIDTSLVNTIAMLRHAPWLMLILLITDLRVKLLIQLKVIQSLLRTSNAVFAALLVSSSTTKAF
jgi:hypothetical protein